LLVLDLDRFGAITRRGQCLADHQCDGFTNVTCLFDRKHGTWCIVPRLAVAADERCRAGHVSETISPNVLSGQH
jgi:hypothetical protein